MTTLESGSAAWARLPLPRVPLKAGLVQFSNETKVELSLQRPDAYFHKKLESTARMNGGTNIAQALQQHIHQISRVVSLNGKEGGHHRHLDFC